MSLKAAAQLHRGLLLPQCSTRLFSSLDRVQWQPKFSPAAAPVAAPAKLARWLCGRVQLTPYKRTAHDCWGGPSE